MRLAFGQILVLLVILAVIAAIIVGAIFGVIKLVKSTKRCEADRKLTLPLEFAMPCEFRTRRRHAGDAANLGLVRAGPFRIELG
ncbi:MULTISPECIES: hypothetical protein [unclassified Brevibacterium]|uniref:hypothetical protein n=1 Tax=unclassified Brevibacterium TaxID=2614124 RepID=UPI000C364486|nr:MULTISPECIES: hypothetical protein [unclassified Brevibacterium]SMX91851.1 hypothetical protein BSP239C_02326 [Brevibacterium sp. 239c]